MSRAARVASVTVGLLIAGCGSSASTASSSSPVTIVAEPQQRASSARATTSSAPPRTTRAPSALPTFVGGPPVSEEEIRSAPWVTLTSDHRVLIDDLEVERTEPYESGPLQKMAGLYDALTLARLRFFELHGRDAFHGVVVLQIESSVRAVVVKCVFQTAAYAGYPNVQFAVEPTASASAAPAASTARVPSSP